MSDVTETYEGKMFETRGGGQFVQVRARSRCSRKDMRSIYESSGSLLPLAYWRWAALFTSRLTPNMTRGSGSLNNFYVNDVPPWTKLIPYRPASVKCILVLRRSAIRLLLTASLVTEQIYVGIHKDEDPVQRVHSPLEAQIHDTVAVGDQGRTGSTNDDTGRAQYMCFSIVHLAPRAPWSREDAKETENSPADKIDRARATLNATS
ncbi:hypothetical protein M405DRAFT_840971 [Rhizopogon salebrosus TDB-379]|nr:hypothetical protein M405DRAFT_840971 [Rhizopogon salebrosus TDB-379]